MFLLSGYPIYFKSFPKIILVFFLAQLRPKLDGRGKRRDGVNYEALLVFKTNNLKVIETF